MARSVLFVSVLLSVLLGGIMCSGQEQQSATRLTIGAVRIGMTREQVLAGLSQEYVLKTAGPYTAIWDKSDNYIGNVTFIDGKVAAIDETILPEYGREGTVLAKNLFREFHVNSHAPNAPDDFQQRAAERYVDLEDVRLRDFHLPGYPDTQTIEISTVQIS